MRIFPDTNVVVSAFIARGLCHDLLQLLLGPGHKHEILIGEAVLAELARILRVKLRLPQAKVDEVEMRFRLLTVVPLATVPLWVGGQDGLILAAALNARADVFVTGDAEVLRVKKPHSGFHILTPRQLWDRLHLPWEK